MRGKYTWSFNQSDEVWDNGNYDGVGECIEAAMEENRRNGNLYEMIYIGENVKFTTLIGVDELNNLKDELSSEAKEWLSGLEDEQDFYIVDNIQAWALDDMVAV